MNPFELYDNIGSAATSSLAVGATLSLTKQSPLPSEDKTSTCQHSNTNLVNDFNVVCIECGVELDYVDFLSGYTATHKYRSKPQVSNSPFRNTDFLRFHGFPKLRAQVQEIFLYLYLNG